jgi:hypothetical protein
LFLFAQSIHLKHFNSRMKFKELLY